jgi:cephalosporin-C deacetylase-like acetyl esterase
MRSDVSFTAAGGTTLRGWLYTPEGARNGPGLVMAHGFSATLDMALDPFARVFCAAGITVLAYDHRNLGASDGEPRQEINIWAQARDYRRAIDWLSQRPEVDARRIGIWGSSFSGGEVLVVAACDRRVAAVIANVPFASLPDTVGASPAAVPSRRFAPRCSTRAAAAPRTRGARRSAPLPWSPRTVSTCPPSCRSRRRPGGSCTTGRSAARPGATA